MRAAILTVAAASLLVATYAIASALLAAIHAVGLR